MVMGTGKLFYTSQKSGSLEQHNYGENVSLMTHYFYGLLSHKILQAVLKKYRSSPSFTEALPPPDKIQYLQLQNVNSSLLTASCLLILEMYLRSPISITRMVLVHKIFYIFPQAQNTVDLVA
jgi:hypothetical protein